MTEEERRANVAQKIARYQGTMIIHSLSSGLSPFYTLLAFGAASACGFMFWLTGNIVLLVLCMVFAVVSVHHAGNCATLYFSGKNMVWAETELLKAVQEYTKHHSFALLMNSLNADDMGFLHRVVRARRWHSRRLVSFG